MGALRKELDDPKMLLADFDAFKFPTSDVVQFRAHVTPCMPTCEPVDCSVTDYRGGSKVVQSYGRRRRSASAAHYPLGGGGSYLSRHARALTPVSEGSNLLVTQSFVVVDKFNKSKPPPPPPPPKKEKTKPRDEQRLPRPPPPPFTPQPAVPGMTFVGTPATEFRSPTLHASAAAAGERRRRGESATSTATAAAGSSSEICLNSAGMVVGLLMLLVAQLMIVFAVVHYMQRRRIRKKTKQREAEDTIAVFNPYTTPRPLRR